jgi:general secretion pathway protein L
LATLIGDFLAWWAGHMLELVPERLRRSDGDQVDAVLIDPQDSLDATPPVVALAIRKRGQASTLGRYTLDGPGMKAARDAVAALGGNLQVWLRLPSELLLEKHLNLPLAAERELNHVIAYEMDRETPFTADEVYWSGAVEQRDRAQGRLRLRLSLIPKTLIGTIVQALDAAGLHPTALDTVSPEGASRRIALDVPRHAEGPLRRKAVALGVAGCAALALLAASLPFILQSVALDRIEAEIDRLKPTVEQAEVLRRQIAGTGAGADVVSAERARLGDPLKILAAATQIFPDDTHLTDFSMRQRKITLGGQSASAANLIGALAVDSTFKDPAFAAPVTRMDGGKTEIFSITTEARP